MRAFARPMIPRRRRQRGQVVVIFALAATAIVALASLAIEGGLIEADRRFDQALSDGAALAGAQSLPSDASAARSKAAKYVVAGVNQGVVPAGCDYSNLAVDNSMTAMSATCDASQSYSVLMQTPYNGSASQILVRVQHVGGLSLARVVGMASSTIGSRSVALSSSGGAPFGFAVFAQNDMTTQGNADTLVLGNIYVTGCIDGNNQNHYTVQPSADNSQKGTVEIYDINNGGPQAWVGSGTGCTATVTGTTGPNQWAASGHSAGHMGCAPAGSTQSHFSITCPSSEQPVPLVKFPTYTIHDTTGLGQACNKLAFQGIFPTGSSTASPGCYSACANQISHTGNVTIHNPTVLSPGTYAFVGNGSAGGCDVIIPGDLSNASSGGDGTGGVTIILYNGASLCASACGNSSGSGTISLNAPTSGSNNGFLIYSCNSSTCASGGGQFWVKGPGWNVTLVGLVYNPGGDCTIHSNANELLTGQLICNNIELQGGAVSNGETVFWNGTLLPIPNFAGSLIE